MADRVAAYAGTRNLYTMMYVSLKSLLLNNKMDRVYLLIEDDEFPYKVPGCVTVVNVSEQEYFPADGANTQSRYSYMALMKCAFSMMFPDEKLILWLDCDTIVDDDITDLFDMNMSFYYYAAVMEPAKSKDIFRYVNVGVLMCNLSLLRATQKDEEIIAFVNSCKLNLPEQETINLLCQGRIRLIDSAYNANNWTTFVVKPKIIHYAATPNITEQWAYKKYAQMSLFKEEGETE